MSESESQTDQSQQMITLPRRVVYFQAALLGIIATTFFLFGLMVGSLTSGNGTEINLVDCEVSGTAVFERDGKLSPDQGAVVLLLPRARKPSDRLNPLSLHPDAFEPLENDAIDAIHELGGAVVRTNWKGEFSVLVDSPAKYDLVLISKNKSGASLVKRQMAALSGYFSPVENIHRDKAVAVQGVLIDGKSKKLGQIKF